MHLFVSMPLQGIVYLHTFVKFQEIFHYFNATFHPKFNKVNQFIIKYEFNYVTWLGESNTKYIDCKEKKPKKHI